MCPIRASSALEPLVKLAASIDGMMPTVNYGDETIPGVNTVSTNVPYPWSQYSPLIKSVLVSNNLLNH